MMALRERLQKLKSTATPAPVESGIDAQWRERLARLRLLADERQRHTGIGLLGPAESLPGIETAPGLHTLEIKVSALRMRLAGLELPLTIRAPWDPEQTVALDKLRFFDTETSGLCGGTGLKVFLLGVLRWQDEAWVLRQYLLSRPSGEAALVRAWQAEQATDAVLVSYNGKRFDIPALSTLETLHGAGRINPSAHWDLLYPVRRAYRGSWPDCRLTTADRMLAGKERLHDLPGSEAPKAWRDYLARGETRNLIRVMQHNRSDLEALLRITKALLHEPRTLPARRLTARARALAGRQYELQAGMG